MNEGEEDIYASMPNYAGQKDRTVVSGAVWDEALETGEKGGCPGQPRETEYDGIDFG